MKGGKNMVYFYCCDVFVRGVKDRSTSGSIETKKRPQTVEEVTQIWEKIREDVAAKYLEPFKQDVELSFTVFNPL